uniref:Uncharacterized protein n=1 Tax=Candidatus Kentrum sp. SD TaxID=2126332 RepID=A0A450Y953_9GAMM|nr:MAG: hypothetical protein BECKSD772F_GA0070984_102028 [Candidatus Kentron sp. SD]VFK42759.1 MAG: hypothetical protein BECKSD772E_GA0070983_101928 [Candidatus Kentron sp. SD]
MAPTFKGEIRFQPIMETTGKGYTVGDEGSFSMYRKDKDSEKNGARARNTPFGAYCYALTNKEHSRMPSVRIYVHITEGPKSLNQRLDTLGGIPTVRAKPDRGGWNINPNAWRSAMFFIG